MTKAERNRLARKSLEEIATRRAELELELRTVYGILLDRTLDEAAADGANVTRIARRAGIARATVYNELERREARAPASA